MQSQSEEKPGFLETCSVCLCPVVLGAGEMQACVYPSCGHVFHAECARQAYQAGLGRDRGAKCPNCNKELPTGRTVTLNPDIVESDLEKPIHQQLRESLRGITKEVAEREALAGKKQLQAERDKICRERNALIVLERRNRLLNDITAASSSTTVQLRPSDRNVMLQLADELQRDIQLEANNAEAQVKRMQTANAAVEAVDSQISQFRRLIEKKKRSLPEGEYERLKAHTAQRRQRSATLAAATNGGGGGQGAAAAAARDGNDKRPDNSADARKKRFGATKDERAVKNARMMQWLGEVYPALASGGVRQPSPILEVKIEFDAKEEDGGSDDESIGADHRAFTAARRNVATAAAAAALSSTSTTSRRQK
jgi:hypothetical protein